MYSISLGSWSVVGQIMRVDKWQCIMTASYVVMVLCSDILQTADMVAYLYGIQIELTAVP